MDYFSFHFSNRVRGILSRIMYLRYKVRLRDEVIHRILLSFYGDYVTDD